MKVHKVTLYVLDYNNLGESEVRYLLELNDDIITRVAQIQTTDCGEWSDDHPLNHSATAIAEYERLFSDGESSQ